MNNKDGTLNNKECMFIDKWDLFIDNLLKYKFNATKSYIEVYNCNYNSASNSAYRLMRNDDFRDRLFDRLKQINYEKWISKELIISNFYKEATDPKSKPADRISALNSLTKILNYIIEKHEETITIKGDKDYNALLDRAYNTRININDTN